MINHSAILEQMDANLPSVPSHRRHRSPADPCLPAGLPSTGLWPVSVSERLLIVLLAVIRREADLIAPKSLLTQLIQDASHSSDALREAMSTSITDSPPQPPVSSPEIIVASPTSPLQRFLSMTKTTKTKGPWKDPEVCNSIHQ